MESMGLVTSTGPEAATTFTVHRLVVVGCHGGASSPRTPDFEDRRFTLPCTCRRHLGRSKANTSQVSGSTPPIFITRFRVSL